MKLTSNPLLSLKQKSEKRDICFRSTTTNHSSSHRCGCHKNLNYVYPNLASIQCSFTMPYSVCCVLHGLNKCSVCVLSSSKRPVTEIESSSKKEGSTKISPKSSTVGSIARSNKESGPGSTKECKRKSRTHCKKVKVMPCCNTCICETTALRVFYFITLFYILTQTAVLHIYPRGRS